MFVSDKEFSYILGRENGEGRTYIMGLIIPLARMSISTRSLNSCDCVNALQNRRIKRSSIG